MPLIALIFLSLFAFSQGQAEMSAELRAGIQTDRSQDPVPEGSKLSMGLGYGFGAWNYQFNYSHIGRDDVGNATVGTKLTTDEFLAWARYNFFKRKHIETYGGVGAGFKIDVANIRLYDETLTEKSDRQWLVGLCAGASVPFNLGASNKQIAPNLELALLNQPGVDYVEVALLLGMSFRF